MSRAAAKANSNKARIASTVGADFQWLLASSLSVDSRLQRELKESWCERKIAEGFDPESFGALEISQRPSENIVLDGQHRVHMLRLLGYMDQLVPCMVHRGLSFPQEARLFLRRNDHRSVGIIDRFTQSVNAEDAESLAIRDIAKEFGLSIGSGNGPGNIQAVKAIQSVYRGDRSVGTGRNPKALRDALFVIVRAWGKEAKNFTGPILHGIGKMFLRDDTLIDRDDLVAKLAKQGGPDRLYGRAKGAKETHGHQMPRCVAGVVTDLYNKGRRINRLTTWWTE